MHHEPKRKRVPWRTIPNVAKRAQLLAKLRRRGLTDQAIQALATTAEVRCTAAQSAENATP